eukprot:jgi/Undpi1/13368/HiC_scaffold_8.g03027.m1
MDSCEYTFWPVVIEGGGCAGVGGEGAATKAIVMRPEEWYARGDQYLLSLATTDTPHPTGCAALKAIEEHVQVSGRGKAGRGRRGAGEQRLAWLAGSVDLQRCFLLVGRRGEGVVGGAAVRFRSASYGIIEREAA